VIATHCHDDLGLATANTLAGIQAGARQAEVTINGIGERAGNACFEEVVMALVARAGEYRVEPGIDTRHIMATSALVARLSGFPVAPNKAVVGANAFAHESGIHQHGMLCDRATYQILDPASVGAAGIDLRLGKLSGRHAVRFRLEQLGREPDDDALERVYQVFIARSGAKQRLTDAELLALLDEAERDAKRDGREAERV
jgi:2-isopropylmalate synthase